MIVDRPQAFAHADKAAVERMLAKEISVKLISLACKLEMPIADPVGTAARCCAEIGRVGEIGGKFGKAQDERFVVALEAEVLDDRSIGQHISRQTTA